MPENGTKNTKLSFAYTNVYVLYKYRRNIIGKIQWHTKKIQ